MSTTRRSRPEGRLQILDQEDRLEYTAAPRTAAAHGAHNVLCHLAGRRCSACDGPLELVEPFLNYTMLVELDLLDAESAVT